MILDEIVLHNFGVYRGRQAMELAPPSAGKPIVLIGGMNGGGKTTIFDALQLALYGKFAQCSNRGGLGYEEFLRRCIHRHADPRDGAAVELQFRYVSGGHGHTYRVHRSWFQNGSGIRERIEVQKDGKLDQVLTDAWYERVEELMPSRISRIFFFDGEKIENFADSENSAKLLSTAFHALLGLDIVDQLSQDLITLQKRKRSALEDDGQRRGMQEADSELEAAEERRGRLCQDRAAAQNEMEQREKDLRQLEDHFRREGGELFEQRQEIEAERAATEKLLRTAEEELREMAAGPAPLLLVGDMLRSINEQDRREEAAWRARALNAALAKRDAGTLKAARSKHPSEAVLQALSDFLEEDRQRRSEQAKVDSYLHLGNETRHSLQSLLTSILPQTREHVSRLLEKTEQVREALSDLDQKLASIPQRDALAELITERERARVAVSQAHRRMEALDRELESARRETDQKRARLTSLIERRVKADFGREDDSRIIIHSQRIRATLEHFRFTVAARHLNRVSELIMDSFKQLLRKHCLVSSVSIDSDTFALALRTADGEELAPDRLSAGERQLLAVSMLWGLARASGRPLPAVIDTPLGRLDSLHRAHMVERYFPYASHQVLLLSTDEEIDEAHCNTITRFVGRSYCLHFDDATESTEIRPGYFF